MRHFMQMCRHVSTSEPLLTQFSCTQAGEEIMEIERQGEQV